MKLCLLGWPDLEWSWKHDIAEAARMSGWRVDHVGVEDADAIVKSAADSDLFIWANTPERSPELGLLNRVRDLGKPTVGVHMDLYFGVPSRVALIGRHSTFWNCDVVFTADGGHQADFEHRRVNHHWMPPAFRARSINRAPFDADYYCAAAFVGAMHRMHRPHRERLVRWAEGRFKTFRWYGPATELGPLRGEALGPLYSSADVILGDSVQSPFYWSDRIPRTLGRGGVLAHPEVPGMVEQGFTEDVMIHYEWGEFRELGRKMKEIGPARRDELRANAMDLIRSRHTWGHRFEQILKAVYG